MKGVTWWIGLFRFELVVSCVVHSQPSHLLNLLLNIASHFLRNQKIAEQIHQTGTLRFDHPGKHITFIKIWINETSLAHRSARDQYIAKIEPEEILCEWKELDNCFYVFFLLACHNLSKCYFFDEGKNYWRFKFFFELSSDYSIVYIFS